MSKFVTSKKEVLSLYREIIRVSRAFQWPNEQGQPWAKILRENARKEIELARHETNTENIARMLVVGWDCLHQVQSKMAEKADEMQGKTKE
ncbi:hypothetical protein SDRG_03508 [Saprolegnia diclina VS20]|uniref:Complex 1 LYR protein domain-containing protein n=1 Tax=Saprolegnia diclina (strain VS20) TaxID=1156394 RepID=T0S2R6_SAPDV|nr:hypothetical protein SDRG_03508 [Saprolegnia diclina VS20]EQC39303.1 hypothetical protein SDRG_03508 [Saprolegnia diclina VS20]|eukprot:XP_008607364.1 hypothetical protein SDRG_03508 [Saprolegnia diclina VS20]